MQTSQLHARCRAPGAPAAAARRSVTPPCPAAACSTLNRTPRMLSGPAAAGGGGWSGRRGLSVSAMFGFKWPWGSDSSKEGGPNSDVLKAARAARPKGCPLAPTEAPEGLKLATFAGGCFWGLELAYQRVPGVVKTSVGYTQGKTPNPTYDEVCMGFTGHTEAVQVTYDPDQATYRQLLDVFFDKVDPTTLNRQGNDRGTQYRSGIYFHDDQQRLEAQQKIAEVNQQLEKGTFRLPGRRVVSELAPAGDYYTAEPYHQQYLERGGRFGRPQSAAKGCDDKIRCYG